MHKLRFCYGASQLRLFLLLPVLLLGGCAFLGKGPAPLSDAEKELRWQTVQRQLSEINHWQLNGRLGVKLPGRSGSMSLDWTQEDDIYTLFLDGPFGQSLAKIKGDSRGVMAEVAGEDKLLVGLSPEHLMMQITGWDLPVSSLKYWVIGLPVPGSKSRVTLNEDGQPSAIAQQGWDITYLSYRDEKGLSLPGRMRVIRDNISLNLVINRWQLK